MGLNLSRKTAMIASALSLTLMGLGVSSAATGATETGTPVTEVASSLAVANLAAGCGVGCIPSEGKEGDDGDLGNPSDPGDDKKDNVDGPGSDVPSTPGDVWYYGSNTVDFRDSSTGLHEKNALKKCGSEYVGATISWKATGVTLPWVYVITNINCLKLKVTTSTLTCVIKVTATIHKVLPDSRQLKKATGTSAWGKLSAAKRKSAPCATNKNHASAATSVNVKEFGRYEGRATSQVANVKLETVKDPIKGTTKTSVKSVGKAYNKPLQVTRGQLTCEGWSMSWSGNPSWSHDECKQGTKAKWRCVAPSGDKLTIDGKPLKSTSLFRDGSAHKIVWGRFKPSSEFRITDKKAQQTRFGRSGTPWKDNGQEKNTDALVSLKNGSTSLLADKWGGWKNGLITKADLRGFWASEKDTPTVITPRWKYKGEVKVTTPYIKSMSSDGKFIWSERTTWVESTGTCDGTPLTASFVRGTTTG